MSSRFNFDRKYIERMNKKIALSLMIVSIMLIGFQIGATAKNESNDYFFLLPLGLASLLVGLFLWIREMRKANSDK